MAAVLAFDADSTSEAQLRETRRARTIDPSLQLVTYAQRGVAAAFEALYALHSKRVYSFCLRILSNRAEAEGLTRSVFLQGFYLINTFSDDGEFARAIDKMMIESALRADRSKRVPGPRKP